MSQACLAEKFGRPPERMPARSTQSKLFLRLMELSSTNVRVSCIQPGLVKTGLHDNWETHPSELMGIPHPLSPDDIARMVLFILDQPAQVRIPQWMILAKDHEI